MWKKIAIAGAVGAAVLGSGAAALAVTGTTSTAGTAVAATSTATPTAGGTGAPGTGTAKGGTAKGGGKLALRLRSLEHAQWVSKGKAGDVTHDAVAGLVTAVSPTSITIKATDGFSATYVVNSSTKVHVKGGSTSISGVVVNDRVLAAGVASGSTVTAARIIDAGPKK